MTDTQQIVEQRLRDAVSEAAHRIATEMDPACPTIEFLSELAVEIERATSDPASVPYPHLLEPDAYWKASVQPQCVALRSVLSEILSWLEEGVVSIMGVAEIDMKAKVELAASGLGIDRGSARDSLEQEMASHCTKLHHLMAEILTVGSLPDELRQAREFFHDSLRTAAVVDVAALKSAYLREAGGDDDHQKFAEEQWSDTHSDRVAHREALLRAAAPWRHQELALTGHERVAEFLDDEVGQVVVRLQAPLNDMSRLLMERFDSAG